MAFIDDARALSTVTILLSPYAATPFQLRAGSCNTLWSLDRLLRLKRIGSEIYCCTLKRNDSVIVPVVVDLCLLLFATIPNEIPMFPAHAVAQRFVEFSI